MYWCLLCHMTSNVPPGQRTSQWHETMLRNVCVCYDFRTQSAMHLDRASWSVVLNEAEVDQSLSANSMAGHMFAMIAKLQYQIWFI